jgi:hypothetical protein
VRRLAVPLVALALVPTPFVAVSLVLWWWSVAAEMPAATWARRAVMGLLVAFAADAGALTVLAVLDVRCSPRVLLAVLLVSALAWRVVAPPRSRAVLASSDDWLAAGFGVLTFAVLYAPFVGASLGTTAALLSRTTDGATHVQILSAVSRHGGYVHLSEQAGMSSGADHYPSGWHGALWLTGETLLGHDLTTAQLVRVTAVGAVASYALLCAVSAAWVLRLVGPRARPTVRATGLVVLAMSLLVGFGVFLAQLGSYTHITAIAVLLVLCSLRAGARAAPYRTLVVAGAASVGVMHSWYLLAPLLAAALATVLPRLRMRPAAWALALVVVAPLCLYPLVTGPSAGHVDLPGPLLLPTLLGVLGLVVAGFAGLHRYLRAAPAPDALPLVAVLVAALVSCVVLIVREGASIEEPIPYYAAKLLLTALVVGAVLASAVVAEGVSRRAPLLVAGAALLGVVAGTASTAGATILPSLNRYGGHLYPATLDGVLATPAEPGSYVLVGDACDRVWDQVATKWWYDTHLTWTPAFALALVNHSLAERGSSEAIRSWLAADEVRHLDVFVHRECDPVALSELAAEPKVTVHRVR